MLIGTSKDFKVTANYLDGHTDDNIERNLYIEITPEIMDLSRSATKAAVAK